MMIMQPQDSRRAPRWGAHVSLVPALIVIAIGVLFLLGNLHIVYVNNWLAYWPVILIAIGLVKLVDSTFAGGRVAGALLMGAGGLILADNLGYLRVDIWELWPLFLIGAGLLMLANRVWWPGSWFGPRDAASADGEVNLVAIFGGSNRKFVGGDFRGGHLAAMFGGVNLDLRKAGMAGDSATLEVATIFGGSEIKVPENWMVVLEGVPIFGGFDDRTVQPPQGPEVKRLLVKGVAIFGGVGVKN